jgi:hypothetical protein
MRAERVTEEWCELIEAAKDDELRISPFARLARLLGVGVRCCVQTERSTRCLLRLARLNDLEEDPDYIALRAWLDAEDD